MIAHTWTLPRFEKWLRITHGWPPLQRMIGHYIGYKPSAASEKAKRRETDEEAAARILGSFGVSIPPPRKT